ncbi:DUF4271 domain-containing protein [Flavobacterium sp. xlx-214]|uniref:DUF4271 domain-containing protein n=1 Tax=unclassified Flavobacterium TaxID=196869 RepID=UPI0013D0AA77|nr:MULTISPECIES: DUF4271 domain-containing protein [unclassified Flavobacterium]MBA5792938.1 DUF4271 domain-containing protein [Flavobacterium sp. xlx-221]QMI84728.1 DUF4271 domain-containing protein [Flavobacterium sp. xlx-214]
MEIDFLNRNDFSVDWATLLFVVTFAAIVITRNAFPNRFEDFTKLAFSNKYLSTYRDTNNMKSTFNISMFFVQMVSISLFIHYIISLANFSELNSFRSYVRILSVLLFFVLVKYFIEKIIALCFDMEDFAEQYNLVKVTYRSYLGLLLFPIICILFYNNIQFDYFLWIVLGLFLLSNAILFFLLLKNYQKLFTKFIFYFILYLCTFEIAPYFILYHWFVVSKT